METDIYRVTRGGRTYFEENYYLKENVRNFKKPKLDKYLIEYYIIQKKILLKNPFFIVLANLIFIVSHLNIHQAVHLNTSKTLTPL